MKIKIKCAGLCKALSAPAKTVRDMVLSCIASVMLLAGLTVLCVAAPTMHKSWLKHKVGQSVFEIVLTGPNDKILGGGTGFEVQAPSGEKYILTNAHVCEAFHGKDITVQLHDGRLLQRRIIEISSVTDLCLAEGLPNVPAVSLAANSNVGDHISVIGHPLLMPLTLSSGEIIANQHVEFPYSIILPDETPEKDMGPESMKLAQCTGPKFHPQDMDTFFGPIKVCIIGLQANLSDAVTFPGNSGSPAVDGFGHLKGVLFAGDSESHYGMLITLSDVKNFLAPY